MIIFGVAMVVVLYVAISLTFAVYIRRSVARWPHQSSILIAHLLILLHRARSRSQKADTG